MPYVDGPLFIQDIEYFSELARKKIDELDRPKLREFLLYLIDEIKFDSNKMEAKIAGHIPLKNNLDNPNNLFHVPYRLAPATRNKKLWFELEVKVSGNARPQIGSKADGYVYGRYLAGKAKELEQRG